MVIDGIDVTELIALGEGGTIEFKLASAGVHDDVFETVCSFANGQGGDMFLGVNDHGQVVGLSKKRSKASNVMSNRRVPRMACSRKLCRCAFRSWS